MLKMWISLPVWLPWPERGPTQTPRQPHPLPRRPGAQSPLARAGYTRQARERHHIYLQRRRSLIRRASFGNDLGPASCDAPLKRVFSIDMPHPLLMLRINSPCRGLWPLRRSCQGHRRNVEPQQLARKPEKPHGTSACARPLSIDRIGMACPTPRTGFSSLLEPGGASFG
jgi:hypothetical protein